MNEILQKFQNLKFEKNQRIILLLVYALIMFAAIQSQLGLISFILLFAIAPIGIYLFVLKIFPKKD